MTENYSVALSKIIDEFSLEKVFLPDDSDDILVHLTEVNRPGLQLAGFFDHFEPQRIQIIGKVEHKYLEFLSADERRNAIMGFLQTKPVAVVFSSNLEVFPEFTELGEYFEVPILRTPETTSAFMAALIASLNVSLAPRITRHGVLVEVYGEGILILGDSGVAVPYERQTARLLGQQELHVDRDRHCRVGGASYGRGQNNRYFPGDCAGERVAEPRWDACEAHPVDEHRS